MKTHIITTYLTLSLSGLATASPSQNFPLQSTPRTPTAPYSLESQDTQDDIHLPESNASYSRDCLLSAGAVAILSTTLVLGGVLYASCDDSTRRGCDTIEDIGEIMMITSGSLLGGAAILAGGLKIYRESKRR
ncbi:MAG: hypothetical protein AB8C84_06650 [Oligoflexales bacterium]